MSTCASATGSVYHMVDDPVEHGRARRPRAGGPPRGVRPPSASSTPPWRPSGPGGTRPRRSTPWPTAWACESSRSSTGSRRRRRCSRRSSTAPPASWPRPWRRRSTGPATAGRASRRSVRSVFRLAAGRPELLGLVREVGRLGPPAATRLMVALDPLVARASSFLEAEMDAGRMRRHEPRLLLLAIYSTVVGMITEVEVLRALGEEPTARSLVRRRQEILRLLRSALLVDPQPTAVGPAGQDGGAGGRGPRRLGRRVALRRRRALRRRLLLPGRAGGRRPRRGPRVLRGCAAPLPPVRDRRGRASGRPAAHGGELLLPLERRGRSSQPPTNQNGRSEREVQWGCRGRRGRSPRNDRRLDRAATKHDDRQDDGGHAEPDQDGLASSGPWPGAGAGSCAGATTRMAMPRTTPSGAMNMPMRRSRSSRRLMAMGSSSLRLARRRRRPLRPARSGRGASSAPGVAAVGAGSGLVTGSSAPPARPRLSPSPASFGRRASVADASASAVGVVVDGVRLGRRLGRRRRTVGAPARQRGEQALAEGQLRDARLPVAGCSSSPIGPG